MRDAVVQCRGKLRVAGSSSEQSSAPSDLPTLNEAEALLFIRRGKWTRWMPIHEMRLKRNVKRCGAGFWMNCDPRRRQPLVIASEKLSMVSKTLFRAL